MINDNLLWRFWQNRQLLGTLLIAQICGVAEPHHFDAAQGKFFMRLQQSKPKFKNEQTLT
jgi:hypothetical protein